MTLPGHGHPRGGTSRDDAGFFAGLREAGVLVRVRFSEIEPGQVTGYAVHPPVMSARRYTPFGTAAGGWPLG